MKKILFETIFAVVLCGAFSTAIFAQGGKVGKPAANQAKVEKIDPRNFKNFDPAKMIDVQKISRQLKNASDLAVTDADLWWMEAAYPSNGKKILAIVPILTKNSAQAQIYALDGGGKLKNLTITVEALDKTGKVLESCQINWLGWTTGATEENFGGCLLNNQTTKNIYDRLRITADPEKLLNEVNTKNNILLTKIPDFNEENPKLASKLPSAF